MGHRSSGHAAVRSDRQRKQSTDPPQREGGRHDSNSVRYCSATLPAELATLCHEQREIETAFDELKTHLRGGQRVLGSKTPEASCSRAADDGHN